MAVDRPVTARHIALMTHPLFEIVRTTAGAVSIRNKAVNEIMHNPVGPWVEANALYIEQSRFAQRLQQSTEHDLVVFDVGLGAAANAVAALHCARHTPGARKLKLISFERDMELLRFALEHADQFDHFRGFEKALAAILNDGQWQEPNIDWQLRHGDFLELIDQETELAHVIFFDPYSPAVNLDMWTAQAFRKLHEKCSRTEATTLYTYSRSTPIRAALLNAGFFVGAGVATGMKDETTQASTVLAELPNPLGKAWLDRWTRSHTPNPLGTTPDQIEQIRQSILRHPQFQAPVSPVTGI